MSLDAGRQTRAPGLAQNDADRITVVLEPLDRVVEDDLRFVETQRNDLARLREFYVIEILYPKTGVVLESLQALPNNVIGNARLRLTAVVI